MCRWLELLVCIGVTGWRLGSLSAERETRQVETLIDKAAHWDYTLMLVSRDRSWLALCWFILITPVPIRQLNSVRSNLNYKWMTCRSGFSSHARFSPRVSIVLSFYAHIQLCPCVSSSSREVRVTFFSDRFCYFTFVLNISVTFLFLSWLRGTITRSKVE